MVRFLLALLVVTNLIIAVVSILQKKKTSPTEKQRKFSLIYASILFAIASIPFITISTRKEPSDFESWSVVCLGTLLLGFAVFFFINGLEFSNRKRKSTGVPNRFPLLSVLVTGIVVTILVAGTVVLAPKFIPTGNL